MSENLLKSAEGQIYTVTSRCRDFIPKGMEGMTTQAEQLAPCLPRSQRKTMLVDDCFLSFVPPPFFWRSLQHTEWCHPYLGWWLVLSPSGNPLIQKYLNRPRSVPDQILGDNNYCQVDNEHQYIHLFVRPSVQLGLSRILQILHVGSTVCNLCVCSERLVQCQKY